MEIEKEKAELIEHFGIHFEKVYHLPPLASRILGILILDSGKKGITFEELVDRTMSSKSSVSTNLNLLLKLGKITYITICGDRKKFFKPSPFSDRLSSFKNSLESEKVLISRLIKFRECTSTCATQEIQLKNILAFQEHLFEIEKVLDRTIERFRENEILNSKQ